MKTKQWTYIDKTDWPAQGEWNAEPDKKQWLDKTTKLPCLIVRGPSGALCGYIGVPKSHIHYGADYDDIDVDVHGGLTFADKCVEVGKEHGICHIVEDGEDDDIWWLGFDCAHWHDFCPQYETIGYSFMADGTYKNIDYVTKGVESLAKQLKEIDKEDM